MINLSKTESETNPERIIEKMFAPAQAIANQLITFQNYYAGCTKYLNDFLIPYFISTEYFRNAEQERILKVPPLETFQSYMELMSFNMDVSNRHFIASMRVMNEYASREMPNALAAVFNTLFSNDGGETIEDYSARHARTTEMAIREYPDTIDAAGEEFGFHFERGNNPKIAETDRFILYQIMPTDESVNVREGGKPILIIPPYVLGANILSFLPGENKSYAHSFANMGIPTYIRIIKDIRENEAVQTLTGEEDALDTKFFCEKIMARHDKPVTLNGYCQGGFVGLCDLLSGELDDVVDAFITCVSPIDGTRSKGLTSFLDNLPARFRDVDYGTKTLNSGNAVGDGELMAWVYKLKSIEIEAPLVSFFRDMAMLTPKAGKKATVSKTAAAINYWLRYDRTDLPRPITDMSFASYTIPITKDGVLPVKLFDRELNIRRIAEKKLQWLICYGEADDLVEKESALAPLDYLDAEVSAFPKGHVAIATSWSNPRSACALHTRFGEKNCRGPVRFQLDLEMEMTRSPKAAKAGEKPKNAKKAAPRKKVAAKKSE